jgi:hypothetical protein
VIRLMVGTHTPMFIAYDLCKINTELPDYYLVDSFCRSEFGNKVENF